MATIIFILILLAGYHFVVEMLLLPVLRFDIKCKLAAERDKLFILKATHKAEISQKTLGIINLFICRVANNLENFGIAEFIFFRNRKNAQIKKNDEVEELLSVIEKHKLSELKDILNTSAGLAIRGMFINSLGWSIYLLPIIIVFVIILLVFSIFLKPYRKFIQILRVKKRERIIIITAKQDVEYKDIFLNGYKKDKPSFFQNGRKMHASH